MSEAARSFYDDDDSSLDLDTRPGPDVEAGAGSGMGNGKRRVASGGDDTGRAALDLGAIEWCADLVEPSRRPNDGWITAVARADSCMRHRLSLRPKTGGKPTMPPRACEAYECETCGPRRVRRHLIALAAYLSQLRSVFVVETDASEATRKRFNDRVRNHRAATVRIAIGGSGRAGTVLLIADVDLRTRSDRSGSMVPPRVAMVKARRAMTVPPSNGMTVRGSKRWPMPNGPDKTGLYEAFMPMVDERTWSEARKRLRSELAATGGTWDDRQNLPDDPWPWTDDELVARIIRTCTEIREAIPPKLVGE